LTRHKIKQENLKMNLSKLVGLTTVAFVTLSAHAFATSNTVIFVSTFDKGAAAPMSVDHGLDMTNMKMMSDMGLHLSTTTAKAGEVTFKVKNTSTEVIHEVLVFPYVEGQPLPYDAKMTKIDEEKAGSLGEVSETDPGKTGELKLTLAPGKYALLCNLPGHFANGMWTILTVN
jgi:uncharacterized cupredoxin-like copper-binding protein